MSVERRWPILLSAAILLIAATATIAVGLPTWITAVLGCGAGFLVGFGLTAVQRIDS